MRYRHVKTVKEHFARGVKLLEEAAETIKVPFGSEVSRQIAVARFLLCTYVTTENVIGWTMAKALLLRGEKDIPKDGMRAVSETLGIKNTPAELTEYMKQIAAQETENVAAALKCWGEDSSIGFEASMEYAFNDVFAEWKNAETERSLQRLEEWLGRGDVL